jgi:fimbrial chaperone protein
MGLEGLGVSAAGPLGTDRFRHRHTISTWLLLALAAGGVLAAPCAEAAAPVAVSPTMVTLSAGKQTDLINLTNQGDDPVRFQLKVDAWEQQADGETVLAPSEDVLVFPPLVSLAPHEARKIRVGAAVGPGAVEKSYRLSAQELPSGQPGGGGQVQMLTKLSLPVFIQPDGARPDPRIDPPMLAGGFLSFTIRDAGSAHFVVRQVKLSGDDGVARRTFEVAIPGWYILPGGRRDYRAELAAADCRKTTTVTIDVETDDKVLHATLAIAAGQCGAGTITKFVSALAVPLSATP